jgi:hypothetical protein
MGQASRSGKAMAGAVCWDDDCTVCSGNREACTAAFCHCCHVCVTCSVQPSQCIALGHMSMALSQRSLVCPSRVSM